MRWDWGVISDMLEYGFQHTDRYHHPLLRSIHCQSKHAPLPSHMFLSYPPPPTLPVPPPLSLLFSPYSSLFNSLVHTPHPITSSLPLLVSRNTPLKTLTHSYTTHSPPVLPSFNHPSLLSCPSLPPFLSYCPVLPSFPPLLSFLHPVSGCLRLLRPSGSSGWLDSSGARQKEHSGSWVRLCTSSCLFVVNIFIFMSFLFPPFSPSFSSSPLLLPNSFLPNTLFLHPISPSLLTDWEPSNLLFLDIACSLYHLLVEDESGKTFLFSDLKRTVFYEMSRELELIVESSKYNWNSSISKSVFRPFNCSNTMIREYFILLGRVSTTPAGKELLEGMHFIRSFIIYYSFIFCSLFGSLFYSFVSSFCSMTNLFDFLSFCILFYSFISSLTLSCVLSYSLLCPLLLYYILSPYQERIYSVYYRQWVTSVV